MKKIIYSILAITSSFVFNSNKTEAQNRCGNYEAQEILFERDPQARANYESHLQKITSRNQQNMRNKALGQQMAVYPMDTIPVVFHVLHEYGSENLSDDVIRTALAKVNIDYQLMAADTSTIRPAFKALAKPGNLYFKLAGKDPLGNCTNGIIHHYDPLRTHWNQGGSYSSNYIYSATSGVNGWKTTKYLNVYLVNEIIQPGATAGGGTVVGYTNGLGGSNGAVQDAIVFNASFLASDWRSLAHEMGHWLGLPHTFGNTNSAGTTCGDDGLNDTPPTKGYFSTCPSVGAMNCGSMNAEENFQNIMDYSSCPKHFTSDQIDVIRATLTDTQANGGRPTLVSDANMVATGLWSTPTACAPVADFTPLYFTSLCKGSSLSFTDISTNGHVTTRSWSFPGGTPSTDTNATVSVTYDTPGTYDVFLQSGNSGGNDTVFRKGRVVVFEDYSHRSPVYTMGFENTDTISNLKVFNFNQDASYKWSQVTTAAASGSASFKMSAFGQPTPGLVDEFRLIPLNFKNYTSISLSFKVAYKARSTTAKDQLRVLVSKDCGQSWTSRYSKLSTALATVTGTATTAFTPVAANWRTETVSIPATYAVEDLLIKFEFTGSAVDINATTGAATLASQNVYVDDINITATANANFSATPLSVNVDSTVSFFDESVNAPTTWSWTASPSAGVVFSDPTAQNPTATFAIAGTYTITLVATGATAKTVTKTAYITVSDLVGAASIVKQKTNLKVVPNPMTNASEITFSLESATQNASVVVYNVLGEKVTTVYNGSLAKGTFSYPINKSTIPSSGIYFVKLSADGKETVAKITVQ